MKAFEGQSITCILHGLFCCHETCSKYTVPRVALCIVFGEMLCLISMRRFAKGAECFTDKGPLERYPGAVSTQTGCLIPLAARDYFLGWFEAFCFRSVPTKPSASSPLGSKCRLHHVHKYLDGCFVCLDDVSQGIVVLVNRFSRQKKQ